MRGLRPRDRLSAHVLGRGPGSVPLEAAGGGVDAGRPALAAARRRSPPGGGLPLRRRRRRQRGRGLVGRGVEAEGQGQGRAGRLSPGQLAHGGEGAGRLQEGVLRQEGGRRIPKVRGQGPAGPGLRHLPPAHQAGRAQASGAGGCRVRRAGRGQPAQGGPAAEHEQGGEEEGAARAARGQAGGLCGDPVRQPAPAAEAGLPDPRPDRDVPGPLAAVRPQPRAHRGRSAALAADQAGGGGPGGAGAADRGGGGVPARLHQGHLGGPAGLRGGGGEARREELLRPPLRGPAVLHRGLVHELQDPRRLLVQDERERPLGLHGHN